MKLNRENKLLIGLCTAAAILIAKLFSIQILDDKYKLSAENNTMVYTTIYPTRGIIHDATVTSSWETKLRMTLW